VLIALAGLLLGGAAAWWWIRSDNQAPAAPETVAASEAAIAPPDESARPLPPLGQMDTFLRALLGTLSAHPDLARWLATDDLIRQMARGIDRISRGQSPAANLQVLRPTGDFNVRGSRSALTINPASFARYDRFAALVESMDARAVADVYRTIQPRLDEAYRELGQTSNDVDTAVDAALRLLIETPIPDEPIAVVPGQGATYAYRNRSFEDLAPAQKQLLRMGPANARIIQARLREIRAELTKADSRSR
jgi:hypothetical protein